MRKRKAVFAIAASTVLASGVLIGCAMKYTSKSWGGGCSAHSGLTNAGQTDYGVAFLTVNDRVYFTLVSEGGNGSCNSARRHPERSARRAGGRWNGNATLRTGKPAT